MPRLLAISLLSFSLILGGCFGGEEAKVEEAPREQAEYEVVEYDMRTDAEQIEASANDRNAYEAALSGDASECDKITFHSLKEKCLKNVGE